MDTTDKIETNEIKTNEIKTYESRFDIISIFVKKEDDISYDKKKIFIEKLPGSSMIVYGIKTEDKEYLKLLDDNKNEIKIPYELLRYGSEAYNTENYKFKITKSKNYPYNKMIAETKDTDIDNNIYIPLTSLIENSIGGKKRKKSHKKKRSRKRRKSHRRKSHRKKR